MAEFTVNGERYRANTLDVMVQMHIVRRLLPTAAALVGVAFTVQAPAGALSATGAEDEPADDAPAALPSLADIAHNAIMPAAQALAALTDDDLDYIVGECLKVTERLQGQRWAPVSHADAGVMFQDLGLVDRLHITLEVLKPVAADILARLGLADLAATLSLA